jgi:putative addiction module killer protein
VPIAIKTTDNFDAWHDRLKDRKAVTIIDKHIYRMKNGDMGNVRSVGDGIFEKKIYFGPGYRLYFINKNNCLILLLCGGDKVTQSKDIKLARKLKQEVLLLW